MIQIQNKIPKFCAGLVIKQQYVLMTFFLLKLYCNLKNLSLVATGFPSGQMPLKTRLEEIKFAVEKGAKEIDIVIDRSLVLTGKWEQVYQEIQQMKEACGPEAHLKAILATGELGTLDNVRYPFNIL